MNNILNFQIVFIFVVVIAWMFQFAWWTKDECSKKCFSQRRKDANEMQQPIVNASRSSEWALFLFQILSMPYGVMVAQQFLDLFV